MRRLASAVAIALLLPPLAAATPAVASEARPVVLRVKTGGFEFTARLKSFDGNAYVIEGPMGTLALEAAHYDCTGEACPAVARTVAPAAPAGAPVASFGIHGSSTIGSALMPALVRGYAASLGGAVEEAATGRQRELTLRIAGSPGKPDLAHIDFQSHGSASAFPALQSGAAEIGMSDRPVNEEELKALNVPGRPALLEHVVGLDGIVVIVARENAAAALTLEQVARVFSGDIADWSALGQPAGPIRVFAPEAGRGTLDIFLRHVMRPLNLSIGPYVTRAASYREIAENVARDPRAIGLVSLADAGAVKPVALRQSCGIVSNASAFAIKTEEYALARRLNLYTRGEPPSAFAQGLLQFAMSPSGQKLVTEARFVDQTIEQVAFAHEEPRFAVQPAWLEPAPWRALVTQLRPAQRLSLTFRFTAGSSELTAKSRQDLSRLAEMVRAGRLAGRTLLLVGYADSIGTPQANSALALKRATQVRTSLLALAPVVQANRAIVPLALGSAAAVACNDTAEGQHVNRRVEVWIRD